MQRFGRVFDTLSGAFLFFSFLFFDFLGKCDMFWGMINSINESSVAGYTVVDAFGRVLRKGRGGVVVVSEGAVPGTAGKPPPT
jgi:hypothetical protein